MATTEDQKKQEEERKRQEEARKRQEEATRKQQNPSGGQPPNPGTGTQPGQHGNVGGPNQRGSQAKTGFATSTYNAQRGADPLAKDPRGDTFLTHDEIKSLAGDIERGELAHLKLDEEGKPTGTVFREIPSPDDVTTTVIAPAYPKFDEIVTPSGAPVSKYMNPDPVLWDAGMLARNPQPEQPGDMPSGPIGGGVVNQPVRV